MNKRFLIIGILIAMIAGFVGGQFQTRPVQAQYGQSTKTLDQFPTFPGISSSADPFFTKHAGITSQVTPPQFLVPQLFSNTLSNAQATYPNILFTYPQLAITNLTVAPGGFSYPGLFATAGTGLTGTGTSTVSLTVPVAIANGGTGTAAPSPVASTCMSITGTWPNNTFTNTCGTKPFFLYSWSTSGALTVTTFPWVPLTYNDSNVTAVASQVVCSTPGAVGTNTVKWQYTNADPYTGSPTITDIANSSQSWTTAGGVSPVAISPAVNLSSAGATYVRPNVTAVGGTPPSNCTFVLHLTH